MSQTTKEEVIEIFNGITSKHHILSENEKDLLDSLKFALIAEITRRGKSSDHPLRVAKALETIYTGNDDDRNRNIDAFQHALNQSNLYPKTKRAAAMVGIALAMTALIVGFAMLCFFFPPVLPLINIVLIAAIVSAVLAWEIKSNQGADVLKTQKEGNLLCNFFSQPKNTTMKPDTTAVAITKPTNT